MTSLLDPMRSEVFNLRDLWVEIHREGIVANGNFDTDTIWSKGTGWTIGSGKATHAGGAGDLTQAGILVSSDIYEVIYTISGRSAGTLTPKCGTAAGTAQSTNDTFTDRITSNGTDLLFSANAAFDGSVDVVSVTLLLTEYWLYINSASLQDKATVKRSPQCGAVGHRLTTISHIYTLSLSRFQAKYDEDFDIIPISPDTTYELRLIHINDQNPSLTETRKCKHCQIESRSLRMSELVNTVPTQWAVGEYTPPS